jgi:hypothetical protein
VTVAGSSLFLPAARFGMLASSFDHTNMYHRFPEEWAKPRMRHATCGSAITWLSTCSDLTHASGSVIRTSLSVWR